MLGRLACRAAVAPSSLAARRVPLPRAFCSTAATGEGVDADGVATLGAAGREPSGFNASGHHVDFHYRELDSTWKSGDVKPVDWRAAAVGVAEQLQAAQAFVQQHGHSQYQAALAAAASDADGDDLLTMPSGLAAAAGDADGSSGLVERNGRTEVDADVVAQHNAEFEQALAAMDAALESIRPTATPTTEDYEAYEAALAGGDPELQKLLHAFETDVVVGAEDVVLHPNDPEFEAKLAELATPDPFDEAIPEDEHALYFNDYDSYRDIQQDWKQHGEHWDDFPSVRLPEPLHKQYKGKTQQVARLLEENPSYTEDDVRASVELYDSLVNKKNAPPEDPLAEFPELDFPPEAPWLYKRPVTYPGEELASRVKDTLDYDNVGDVAEAEARAVGLMPGDDGDGTVSPLPASGELEPQNYAELEAASKGE